MNKAIIQILLFLFIHCGISTTKEGELKIVDQFIKTAKASKNSKAATLLVHSNKLNLHIKSSYGFVNQNNNQIETIPNQPFHIASIGKIFTATLIFQFIEEGKLSLDSKIIEILGEDLLKELFEINGKNYSDEVTVLHLLSHTSGVADYFESVDKNGKSVLKEITKNPDHFWTAMELIDFTKKNQKAFSKPGDKFHYSDTGYILLGLVAEKISKKSFETLLEDRFFKPLEMNNSYMHLRSKPLNKLALPISPMMLGDKNVTSYKSISSDWAGGGIISTTEDLLIFQKSLISGKLVDNKNYLLMNGENEFMSGILYGKGLMTVKFGQMSLFMPNTPDLFGHSGLLGTLCFYSPDYDSHIIVNLGSTDAVGDSFELMFWIMQSLKEIQVLQSKGN